MKKIFLSLMMLLVVSSVQAKLKWFHPAEKDVYFQKDGVDYVRLIIRCESDSKGVHPRITTKIFILKKADVCDASGKIVDDKLIQLVEKDPIFTRITNADKGISAPARALSTNKKVPFDVSK